MSQSLLQAGPPRVINVGLRQFADELFERGNRCVHVNWQPPARGDLALAQRLDALVQTHGQLIADANGEAFSRMQAGQPVLVRVAPAKEVIPALAGNGPSDVGASRLILHAGPPVTWERMCGPMRGAVAGAAVFEGWAKDLEQGFAMAAAGEIEFQPNHEHDAVGPMTGMTTANMPVLVVENKAFGNFAYCTLNEGLGKVMRFGGNDETVIARLRWLRDVLAPAMNGALAKRGGVDLKAIVARGLTMGDEMHQRNVACTSLFIREIAPALAAVNSAAVACEALEFLGGNDQFFLNIAMVLGKAIMDPVAGIRGASVVTAMARNGTDFGVRVSGTASRWYVAPVEMPEGLYFPGFSAADANPDMGDSTIVETIGLGGFSMAASPAVAGFVGAGTAMDALQFTQRMREITYGPSQEWTIPALDFAGVPTGIDVLKVVRSGEVPTINTGIAHREPGVGQVGAGVVTAPFACFAAALDGLAEALSEEASRP